MAITITINGQAYPCRQTMGAMLRFRRETGREVTQMGADALSDMAVYLWCCVRSACQADGVAFDMNLMTFLDSLAPEDLTRWSEQAGGETATSEGGAADDKAQKKAAGNPEALRICIGRDAAGS